MQNIELIWKSGARKFYASEDGKDFYRATMSVDGEFIVDLVDRNGMLIKFLDVAQSERDVIGIMRAHQYDKDAVRQPEEKRNYGRLRGDGKNYGKERKVIR